MMMLERVIDGLAMDFRESSEQEYRRLMVFSVAGIFVALSVLAVALLMVAIDYRPWEEKR